MVALAGAFLVSFVLIGVIVGYNKRRPVGTPLTWGEAMVAAVFVFFCFFWVFGVLPQTWILYSANELKWSPDHILIGHGGTLVNAGPIKLSEGGVGDIITTLIYGYAVTAFVALMIMWNRRGRTEGARRQLGRGRTGRRALARPGQPS